MRRTMNKKSSFLKWWLLNSILVIIGFFCYKMNVFHEVYKKDSSFLCFVILGIFIVNSCYNGCLAYRIDSENGIENKLETSWFFSEICLSLGMIGTVVGFIQMLAGFSSLNTQNISSVQSLIVSMSYGMSTALYTTLAGLIFGNLLKLQAFDLQRTVEKMKGEDEKK